MKPRAFKRIWGKPWDYSYLLILEYHKLKEMANHFEKHKYFEGWEEVVKEIRLCLKLIDIVLERDPKRYCINSGRVRTYVNVRNCDRFCSKWECSVIRKRPDNELFKDSLRTSKALYLYNKIRAYKMQRWWD